MLRIRLSRVGKKKQAHFRVVVADIESPRDGRIVESIGHYTPLTDPSTYKINEERALHWLSVGAQPTDAVRDLLRKQGTYERLERLRAGEPLEALVAEYEGEPEEEAAPAAQAEEEVEELEAEAEAEEPAAEEPAAEEPVAEEAEEESLIEETVDAVADAADETVAVVEEVVEEVSEEVSEAVEEVAEEVADEAADEAVDEEE